MTETRLKVTYRISVQLKGCPLRFEDKVSGDKMPAGVIKSAEITWVVKDSSGLQEWPMVNAIMSKGSEMMEASVDVVTEMVSSEEVPYDDSMCPICLARVTKHRCDRCEGSGNDLDDLDDDGDEQDCDECCVWARGKSAPVADGLKDRRY